jgi:hypothetical protein
MVFHSSQFSALPVRFCFLYRAEHWSGRMRHKVLSVSSFILACAILLVAPEVGVARADELRSQCPPASESDFFFPVNALDDMRSDIDALEREHYSWHLAAMRQSSLSRGAADAPETYRFLWLRSFHRSISVRVALKRDGARIEFTELTGAGGFKPGHIRRHTERQLSRNDVDRFAKALKDADFWQLPTRFRDFGLDGAQWIVEGRRGGTYHVVDRFTPEGGTYRALGLLFLKLAYFSAPPLEIY